MSYFIKLALTVAVLSLSALASNPIRAQADSTGSPVNNLVVNSGFETGGFDFGSDWVSNGNAHVSTTDPHTGTYAAQFSGFGEIGEGVISTLATTPGQTYTLDFFLDPAADAVGSFSFGVGDLGSASAVFTPVSYSVGAGYQEFTASYTAATNRGSVSFKSGTGSTGRFSLDDVLLRPAAVPEASTALTCGLLLALGVGLTVRARVLRKSAA